MSIVAETETLPPEIIEAHEASVRLARSQQAREQMDQVIELMTKAAVGGHPDAQCNLGYLYSVGDGVPQNVEEGMRWTQAAAEQGSVQALYNLSQMYASGVGVQKNAELAMVFLRKAANAGQPDALYNLGIYSYNGMNGLPQDLKAAFIFFENAGTAGHGAALFSAGLCCSLGHGVEKDEMRAVEFYKKASEAGDANGMFNLGLYHFYGEGGLMKDLDKAEDLFKRAAALGHEKAAHAAASIPEERAKLAKEEDPFANINL